MPNARWHEGKQRIGTEVTISQSRARYILGEELVETKGTVRGYLGLQDDGNAKEIEATQKSKGAMYVTTQPLATGEAGIRRCLKKKKQEKHKDMKRPRCTAEERVPFGSDWPSA